MVEETVKTGMALGTKIGIGVAVATISIGGIALGSTLLKDNTPTTEQRSEDDTQQNMQTEQNTEQDTVMPMKKIRLVYYGHFGYRDSV